MNINKYQGISIIIVLFCLGLVLASFGARAETVSTSVTITVCGNNLVEGNETCDDGNTIDGDGCSSTCQTEGAEAPSAGDAIKRPPTNPDVIAYYTRVILDGKAYPDALVNILKDGQFLTSLRADSKADFRTEIKDLTPGTYTFGLWAEDKNKLRSPTFTITFYVAPAVTTTVSGVLLPPTIKISKDALLKGEGLEISGQAIPDGKITTSIYQTKPYFKEIFQDAAIVGLQGDWLYLFDTKNLKEGDYEIKAKVSSKEGLLSIFSKTLSLEISLAPLPPIPPELPKPPVPPTPPVSGACPAGDLNKDSRVNFIDFSILLYWWEKTNNCADQNGNGVVDLYDFSITMYYWTG